MTTFWHEVAPPRRYSCNILFLRVILISLLRKQISTTPQSGSLWGLRVWADSNEFWKFYFKNLLRCFHLNFPTAETNKEAEKTRIVNGPAVGYPDYPSAAFPVLNLFIWWDFSRTKCCNVIFFQPSLWRKCSFYRHLAWATSSLGVLINRLQPYLLSGTCSPLKVVNSQSSL